MASIKSGENFTSLEFSCKWGTAPIGWCAAVGHSYFTVSPSKNATVTERLKYVKNKNWGLQNLVSSYLVGAVLELHCLPRSSHPNFPRTINTRYSVNAKNARSSRARTPPLSVDCNFAPRRLNLDWNKLAEISLRRMRNEVKERRPPIGRVYVWLQHSTIHYLSLLWRPGRFLRPETGLRIVRVGCT